MHHHAQLETQILWLWSPPLFWNFQTSQMKGNYGAEKPGCPRATPGSHTHLGPCLTSPSWKLCSQSPEHESVHGYEVIGPGGFGTLWGALCPQAELPSFLCATPSLPQVPTVTISEAGPWWCPQDVSLTLLNTSRALGLHPNSETWVTEPV